MQGVKQLTAKQNKVPNKTFPVFALPTTKIQLLLIYKYCQKASSLDIHRSTVLSIRQKKEKQQFQEILTDLSIISVTYLQTYCRATQNQQYLYIHTQTSGEGESTIVFGVYLHPFSLRHDFSRLKCPTVFLLWDGRAIHFVFFLKRCEAVF